MRQKIRTFTAYCAANMYIHKLKNWPDFYWNNNELTALLANVRHRQGRLLGRMEALGFRLREDASLQTLTLEIVKSNEIEGEILDKDQVRSSLARRLGMDIGGLLPADRNVEGVVDLMLDATQNFGKPLSDERLFGWHAALFPTGRSGMHKIVVGNWRDDRNGPMQVVSGGLGRENVHYEAPAAARLHNEMKQFLDWFNGHTTADPVLKAAITHLSFITIHPLEDGNGRVARAIADMQLARADASPQRFYSMSGQIEREKTGYYEILESTQKGSLDITGWIKWFLHCLDRAIINAEDTLAATLKKSSFWEHISGTPLNPRQHTMINKLLDDFFGKLTSSKWAKLTKCSQDTALRDIQDLVEKGVLTKDEAGGRSTSYILKAG